MKILYKQNILLALSEFRCRTASVPRAGSTLSLCIFYWRIQPSAHPHQHSKAQELGHVASLVLVLLELLVRRLNTTRSCKGELSAGEEQLGFGPRFGINSLNVSSEQVAPPFTKCTPELWSSSASSLGNLCHPMGSNEWQLWAAWASTPALILKRSWLLQSHWLCLWVLSTSENQARSF